MKPGALEVIASVLFLLAVLHTFLVKRFQHLAMKFPEGSALENFFHLMGEIEIVFGLWAGVLIATIAIFFGWNQAIHYLDELKFTEPIFVFVIMTIAASRPVICFASALVSTIARSVPLTGELSFFLSSLIFGPLLGSFITEPAAMTITALILKRRFFDRGISPKLMYVTLAVLFVNVSIGGVLSHFAAPPVLMVASIWGWGISHMFSHFGWKAVLAVIINTAVVAAIFHRDFKALEKQAATNLNSAFSIPWWLIMIHLGFLILVVIGAHHPPVFIGLFLFFLGVTTITREFQEELKLRESLLVGFFLGGLVVLGGLQRWWLEPLISSLDAGPLFLGATFLTAFTDNAALTYLGAQVPNLLETIKYALVAGAVAGGGLTVIANAPNPAGFTILKSSFGSEGISPLYLFVSALAPTAVTMACFWFLPF